MAPKAKAKARGAPGSATKAAGALVLQNTPAARQSPAPAAKAAAQAPVAKAAAHTTAVKAAALASATASATASAKASTKAGAKPTEIPVKSSVPPAVPEVDLEAEERRQREVEEQAEEKRKAEEVEEKRKAEEEAFRKRKEELANGDVVLKYSMYNEKFPIKNGSITSADIDDVYCLSGAMPNCKVHLSLLSSESKYKMVSSGQPFPYIPEEPSGTFQGLEAGQEYYVYVDEDEEEFLKSQAHAKSAWAGVKGDKTRGEGCSCIEGNPCGQECDQEGNSVCLDWANRFAVAKAHGWIGYQAK